MIISPCAMLMTPITPKVIASPIAASSSTLPRLMPWNRLAASPVSRRRLSIAASASSAALRNSRIEVGLVAEFVEQVLDLRVGGRRRARGWRPAALPCCRRTAATAARLRCIAARISGSCSAASAFSSSARGIGRGMPQRVLRRGAAGRRVGAEQGQAAERRLDRAAQPVVDDDAVEPVGRRDLQRCRSRRRSAFVVPPVGRRSARRGRPAHGAAGPSASAFRTGTARGSPSLPSATIAFSLSAKLSPPSPATRVGKLVRRAPAARRSRRQRDNETASGPTWPQSRRKPGSIRRLAGSSASTSDLPGTLDPAARWVPAFAGTAGSGRQPPTVRRGMARLPPPARGEGEGALSASVTLNRCISRRCSCRRPRDRSSRRPCPCLPADAGSRRRP